MGLTALAILTSVVAPMLFVTQKMMASRSSNLYDFRLFDTSTKSHVPNYYFTDRWVFM